ncbi:PREDICTED: DNA polymerase delta catalytic subunit-like, partial [Amphimedon queenslandica]|uniref:DNA polymerase n=1 Tax=Amphimedon queenslandica TaxID=400682 RepID=A0A1X7U9F4_AMPQE
MASIKRSPPPDNAAGSSSKKLKTRDSDSPPPNFEDDLALLEVMEDEDDSSPESKWRRPSLPPIDPSTDSVVFQHIDIESYVSSPIRGVSAYRHLPSVPVLKMYGVTQEGFSVCAHVHSFMPYLYVASPFPQTTPITCKAFQDALSAAILSDARSSRETAPTPVLGIEVVSKSSLYGYQFNQSNTFLKVILSLPRFIAPAKRLLELGLDVKSVGHFSFSVFESNIEYEVRFMIDTDVVGCNWIEVPPGKYSLRKFGPPGVTTPTTRCQIELDVSCDDFISHTPEGEWQKIAPLRILSFDIECAGRKGVFPEADVDPVIQIANMIQVQGDPAPFIRNVFTLGSCSGIVGSDVRSFANEKDLLQSWCEFLQETDPDILTGYNIVNFDLPYLINRAKALKLQQFPYLGRTTSAMTVIKTSTFESKAYGKRENKLINISGRVQFDLLQVLFRDTKLRSYSLNSVSYHFLKEQKEDVPHNIITDLQNGNEDSRRRLAVYCMKDAILPLRLLEKLMSLINYIEMARVTGVPLNYLLTRGQQIKVVSQLLRKAKKHDLLMPVIKSESQEEYLGGHVIEPQRGYYSSPISVLDFSSLYPSIMQAHNLCYTTLILRNVDRDKLDPEDYIKTPSGNYFVKESVRRGILPEILEDLLSARKKAKQELKNETDPFRKKVLDGRQLALKVSANSVYGFTGATVGKLPCIEISQSVTSFGRQMIETSQKLIESKYCVANGFPYDTKVIYGDTDSVMILFGHDNVTDSIASGKEAAAYVSTHFPPPIKLEFEK